jgi:hypothetical protein
MANRNYPNGKSIYIPHVKPTLIDCNFVVDSANGNGLGIRSLKGAYVKSVYMHTSATPATGNPNPASGYIVVTLTDNFNAYLGGFSGQVSALSGSNISSGMTAHVPYVITSLGSTTAAQWQTAGLSANITPAVGVAFIAAATSVAGGGTVQALHSGGSGIDHIEVVGDSNLSNSTNPQTAGKQIIMTCYSGGSVTAPTDGSVLGLTFYLNDSSVPVGSSS